MRQRFVLTIKTKSHGFEHETRPTPAFLLTVDGTQPAFEILEINVYQGKKGNELLTRSIPVKESETGKTILGKLHAIEEAKCIYDIHYCKAGVGFLFYDPPKDFERGDEIEDKTWRKYLTVDAYYPTFEKAVEAEYKRIVAKKLVKAIEKSVNGDGTGKINTTHRVGENEPKPGELLNIEKCGNPNCLICYGTKK